MSLTTLLRSRYAALEDPSFQRRILRCLSIGFLLRAALRPSPPITMRCLFSFTPLTCWLFSLPALICVLFSPAGRVNRERLRTVVRLVDLNAVPSLLLRAFAPSLVLFSGRSTISLDLFTTLPPLLSAAASVLTLGLLSRATFTDGLFSPTPLTMREVFSELMRLLELTAFRSPTVELTSTDLLTLTNLPLDLRLPEAVVAR